MTPEPVAVAEPNSGAAPTATQTVGQYLAAAPSGMRDVLTEMKDQHANRKAALVKAIIANKANQYTEAQLNAKDHKDLACIAALAHVPTVDYTGQVGAEPVKQNTGVAAPAPLVFDRSKNKAA